MDRDRPEVDLGLRPRLLQLRHEPSTPLRPPLLAPPRSPGGGGPRTSPRTNTTPPRHAHRAAGTQARLAVCRCLRGASRSSTSIASISGATASRAGDARSGTFRGASTATPAPPAPSAGAPRASGRSPGPPSPAGDPPGPQRTVPPCPVPSAPRERVTAECDHYPRSRTTCPATSPACRRKPPHGRGQIRGELTRPAPLTGGAESEKKVGPFQSDTATATPSQAATGHRAATRTTSGARQRQPPAGPHRPGPPRPRARIAWPARPQPPPPPHHGRKHQPAPESGTRQAKPAARPHPRRPPPPPAPSRWPARPCIKAQHRHETGPA